jgi:hypothetical protein
MSVCRISRTALGSSGLLRYPSFKPLTIGRAYCGSRISIALHRGDFTGDSCCGVEDFDISGGLPHAFVQLAHMFLSFNLTRVVVFDTFD